MLKKESLIYFRILVVFIPKKKKKRKRKEKIKKCRNEISINIHCCFSKEEGARWGWKILTILTGKNYTGCFIKSRLMLFPKSEEFSNKFK